MTNEKNQNEKETMIKVPLLIVAAMIEAASVATSQKASRPMLGAVNISSDGEKIKAAATDSARLNMITFDLKAANSENNAQYKALGNISFNLSKNDIAKILNAKKDALKEKALDSRIAAFERDDKKINFTVEDLNGDIVQSSKLETIAGDYPNLNNIMPKNNGGLIAFNPQFIGDCKQAMKALKASGDCVLLNAPSGATKPFTVELQSGLEFVTGLSLITPMRAENEKLKGWDYLTSGNAAVTEYKNKINYLESRLSNMEEQRNALNAELQKALRTQDKPAAVPDDDAEIKKLQESLKDANGRADSFKGQYNAALNEIEQLKQRLADAMKENENAANEIKRICAENSRLKNGIENMRLTLESKQEEEKKPDGGQQPATERQRAYIAKLGGNLPDGATIRDASILITQLKKNRSLPTA